MIIHLLSTKGGKYSFDIDEYCLIKDLKQLLSEKISIISERIDLIYESELLNDNKKI